MPKLTTTDFLNDPLNYVQKLTGYDSTLTLNDNVMQKFSDVLTSFQENEYQKTTDVFPEDLGMDYYGHYIKIKAFTGGYQQSGPLGFDPPSTESWNGYVYIPNAAGQGQAPLIYDQKHNFTDIRLTSIINDSILGITAAMATRRSINPMVQVLYRSTNLRQFGFSLLMTPKSRREAESMKNITKKLRAFAAPEINNAAVIAPAEFEFEFYNKGKINPNIPRIERCVITNVTANYIPQGDFSAFRDGHSTACLLTFDATEVRIVDRNLIMNGKPDRSGHGF